MEEVVPMDKNEWFYVWSKKEKILVFLAEKKVLQKFYKNSKNLEFFQKKCFFVFFDVFSHFEVKNEVPEHLRWLFEVFWDIFFSMNILLKHLTDVFEISITFWNLWQIATPALFRRNAKRFGGRTATTNKGLCNSCASNEEVGRILKMKKINCWTMFFFKWKPLKFTMVSCTNFNSDKVLSE